MLTTKSKVILESVVEGKPLIELKFQILGILSEQPSISILFFPSS